MSCTTCQYCAWHHVPHSLCQYQTLRTRFTRYASTRHVRIPACLLCEYRGMGKESVGWWYRTGQYRAVQGRVLGSA
eukprot:3574408-Rhodomonas_salina.1